MTNVARFARARYARKSQLMVSEVDTISTTLVVDPLDSLTMSLLPSKVRRNGLFWLPQERASKAKVFGHPIKERVTEGNE